MSLSFVAPIDPCWYLQFRSRVDEQLELQEQNESVDTTPRISERLQALHEKTSELNKTLENVEKTLEEANNQTND